MTTQELRTYIDRVLGNGIRCLLPSYWWKRLFNLTIDKVDGVEEKVTDAVNRLDVLENKEGSSGSVYFIIPTNVDGELSEESKQINRDAYAKVQDTISNGKSIDVKVIDYTLNTAISVWQGGTDGSILMVKYCNLLGDYIRLMVYSDGTVTGDYVVLDSDLSAQFISSAVREISSSEQFSNQTNYEKVIKYNLKIDTKIWYQLTREDRAAFTATSMSTNEDEHLVITAADAGKIFTIAPDGSITDVDLPDTSITVDSQLSDTSENPVQNKVLYKAFADLANEVVKEIDKKVDNAVASAITNVLNTEI